MVLMCAIRSDPKKFHILLLFTIGRAVLLSFGESNSGKPVVYTATALGDAKSNKTLSVGAVY